jgi:hypothetical protein
MTAAEKLINDCVSPFTQAQRERLKYLSKVQPQGSDYPAMPNVLLEEYISQLKDMYPEMFQTNATLKHRVFFDEPTPARSPTEHARFVRAKEQSPYRSNK